MLWSFPEITSRGQPGFPNSCTVAMQKRKMRVSRGTHPHSARIPTIVPLMNSPSLIPPSVCGILMPLASYQVFINHHALPYPCQARTWGSSESLSPSFLEVCQFYLFSFNPSPSCANRDNFGAKVQGGNLGSASVFSILSSHSPPARCLGRLEQMFHFGLTMAESQASNAL